MKIKVWISAFRLRTLPLALSCVGMGGFLAASANAFRPDIFILCALTTVFLQILSNLANDYGDSVNGADHQGRVGPLRAVQSGSISREAMKRAIWVLVIICLLSGLSLLLVSFGNNWRAVLSFFGLGILSIIAAIAYTVGRKPYGYAGLGDFAVLVFFGLVGVMGSFYLFTQSLSWDYILPALSCGFFSVGVLNINNLRDIESDRGAGKYSLPVRLGRKNAIVYHWLLLSAGIASTVFFFLLNDHSPRKWLFLATVPLFAFNAFSVSTKEARQLDPYLKQMALITLLYVILFGLGIL